MTHDPKVVSHLRSALDEVAAKPLAHATHTAPARRALDTRRWVAIAASLVIVAGAAVGIAMYRGDDTKVATGPTSTTAPSTGGLTMPYFLAAADLNAEEVLQTPCCPVPADAVMVVAWGAVTGLQDGILLLTVHVHADTQTDSTDRLEYASYGLSEARAAQLEAKVVPGSGLPYVLPDDSMEYLGSGTQGNGALMSQRWASDTGAVLIAVGDYRGQLTPLALAATADQVTVAGSAGLRWTDTDGVHVVWRTDDGKWATVDVSPTLAGRVDELIAAVRRSPVEVSMDTATSSYALATFDGSTPDPAVGQKVPPIQFTTGELTVDSPTLFVFVAHWCPHCAKEIPLLQQAIDDGSLNGARVVLVSTAVSSSAANYPAASWLEGLGWTGETVNDTTSSDGAAGMMAGYFGTPGFPYLVMVGSDGLVTARASGEMPIADVVAFAHTAK